MRASAGLLVEARALQQAWNGFVKETGSNHQDEKRMGQEGVGAREEYPTITAISTAPKQLGRPPEAWLAGCRPQLHSSWWCKGSAQTTPPAYRGVPAPLGVLQSHLPPRRGCNRAQANNKRQYAQLTKHGDDDEAHGWLSGLSEASTICPMEKQLQRLKERATQSAPGAATPPAHVCLVYERKILPLFTKKGSHIVLPKLGRRKN